LTQMNRRELVRNLAYALTALSAAPAFAGAVAEFDTRSRGDVLSSAQLNLLEALVDYVIPDTDTPGARAAGVPDFINYLLTVWYSAPEREKFSSGLSALGDIASHEYHRSLAKLPTKDAIALLTRLEEDENDTPASEFVAWLKELTVLGYYTSEIGATEELRYLAIPGNYQNCIELSAESRTWAR
jgi:hypothetical protein